MICAVLARLEGLRVPPTRQPVGLAEATLHHPALERIESLREMDLKTASFSAYWRLAAATASRMVNQRSRGSVTPMLLSNRSTTGTVG